jgi:hypothetical protein
LRPVTQADLARRYGYFLSFLALMGSLDMNAPAGSPSLRTSALGW